MMVGTVGFENHRIHCIIGVNDDERDKEQEIFVDLKVCVDFTQCVLSDHIEDAVNYVALAELCTDLAQKNRYYLLEKFAADVLDELFRRYSISVAWIKVKKPHAIATADFAMIELTRKS